MTNHRLDRIYEHSPQERATSLVVRGLLFLAAVSALVGCGSTVGQIEDLSEISVIAQRKVYVDVTNLTLTEGSVAVVNVALTDKANSDSVVQLMLLGPAGRFQPVPISLTIPQGTLSKSVVLQTINNSIYDGNAQFQLIISSFDPAIDVSSARLSINLIDDDLPPTISVASLAVNEAAGSAAVTVSLSAASAFPVTFAWSTADGTAVAPGDFTAQSSVTGTIAPGSTSTTIAVAIADDAVIESSENFVVTLSGLVGATAGTLTGTVTITDNDVLAPMLSLNNETTSDQTSNLIFTVVLNAAQSGAVSVDYATSNGTAISGTDFTNVSGTVTIAAGQTTATITVPVLYRVGSQGNRNFTVTLSNPVSVGLSNTTATGTINDGFSVAPHLVKEINTVPSLTTPMKVIGSNIFFTNYDTTNGTELWISDGTNAGTMLLKDIRPGSAGSSISNLIEFGGILYFLANDGVSGTELWRSDGTPAGTYLFKDLNPGPVEAYPAGFTVVGSKMFFSAYDPTETYFMPWVTDGTGAGTISLGNVNTSGEFGVIGTSVVFGLERLYISDGTVPGTALVKDIYPGNSASIGYLTSSNGLVYFSARTAASGREPWVTDGTLAGTFQLAEVGTLPTNVGNGNPDSFTSAGGGLTYFRAADATTYSPNSFLFVTDGTALGTVQMTPFTVSSGPQIQVLGSKAIFVGFEAISTGSELWVSDGTTIGTTILKDIFPGVTSSNVSFLGKIGSNILFTADNGTNGAELWRTDGTAVGTVLVKDINPGLSGANISQFTTNGTIGWFIATDGTSGMELWKTDGTTVGTVLVKDLNPGAETSNLRRLTGFGSGAFFFAYDSSVGRVRAGFSDGTDPGTSFFPAAPSTSFSANIANMAELGGKLYFSADDGGGYGKLWESDNTLVGTKLVKDIMPDAGCVAVSLVTKFNSSLFFVSSGAGLGVEPYVSDGTTGGTGLIKDLNTGLGISSTYFLTAGSIMAFGSKIFFAADAGSGIEPHVSDGTSGGTVLLGDLYSGASGSSPNPVGMIGSNLIFSATGSSTGTELWITNGTAVGTQLIKDINPGTASSYSTAGVFLGSNYVFPANDGTNGTELWITDGTNAGTSMIKNIASGATASTPVGYQVIGSKVVFYANDAVNGYEPWVSDGTSAGTILLKDVYPGITTSGISFGGALLSNNGTRAFFRANDGVNGFELWSTDGTPAGTIMVKDFNVGAGSSDITSLGVVGSRAVFLVYNGSTYTLWSSDGTVAGTYSIQPAGMTNTTYTMTLLGGVLYFRGTTAASGGEIWRTDGTVNGTYMIADTVPGTGSLTVGSFFMANGVVYMYASDDAFVGSELWSFTP